MWTGKIGDLGTLSPIADRASYSNLACTLDREADLALLFGHAAYAEHLTRRAAEMREREVDR